MAGVWMSSRGGGGVEEDQSCEIAKRPFSKLSLIFWQWGAGARPLITPLCELASFVMEGKLSPTLVFCRGRSFSEHVSVSDAKRFTYRIAKVTTRASVLKIRTVHWAAVMRFLTSGRQMMLQEEWFRGKSWSNADSTLTSVQTVLWNQAT